MQLFQIRNDELTVQVDPVGAQLMSVRGKDGTEYLWQGDPRYWKSRAPTLFPYVGRLTGGQYRLDGGLYSLPIHGFAPRSDFSVQAQDAQHLTLELTDSEQTRACYPFRFRFRVAFALEGASLTARYSVENTDAQEMVFGLGGHPGFNVPLDTGAFEDWQLRFGAPCSPVRIGFADDYMLSGDDTPFSLEGGTVLPLRHELFARDAIVLKDAAPEVTLESRAGGHRVTMSFADFPYLGIWQRPDSDAPYVCLEPWASLPSRSGVVEDLRTQPTIRHLGAGETCSLEWRIRVE